ncbi:restriction endonuclease subunit S [Sutcliffiella horikoshii]|uniref:Restriction endonuclease subunit S n=1 Tax=Sutcliffiella horikoshii TaxID=79883 RepID=A0A5D4SZN3_9BACI|nr:restriction endonuclease subunit S [Sutcliffiella horikoshii]TYS67692.1 restriction endonuclease subunit S [Sutcliffiella horikoshii]
MNAPKLRFETFKKEWNETTLGDLLSFNNGINADKNSYGHGRKFINVLDILNNNFIKYSEIIGLVSVSSKMEESNKVEYGDLLFLRSSETRDDVGKSSVYLDENEFALFGGFVIRGKKQADYHPYFLKLNLESPNVRNQIGTKAGGSTRFNVSQSILSSVELKMPSKDEQSKIAEFFSTLDLKIQKQQVKISLLNKQKKGYIQQIFNQNQNGWSLFELGDLFEERSERGYEEYQLLAVTLGKGVTDRTGMKKDTSSEDKSSYKRVLPDDIAYNSMRMWQGASGHSIFKGIVSPAYTVLKPREQVYSLFFAYLFKTDFMLYQFKKYSQGLTSDTWNLKYPLLKDIKVKVPSYEEQKKIASLFSKLDSKIQLETKKLGILQEQKKAFMQQMFI